MKFLLLTIVIKRLLPKMLKFRKIATFADYPLRFARTSPISKLSFGTMDINALVINGLDPGAVPGDSTKHPLFGDHGVEIGSTNV